MFFPVGGNKKGFVKIAILAIVLISIGLGIVGLSAPNEIHGQIIGIHPKRINATTTEYFKVIPLTSDSEVQVTEITFDRPIKLLGIQTTTVWLMQRDLKLPTKPVDTWYFESCGDDTKTEVPNICGLTPKD